MNKIILKGRNGYQLREASNKLLIVKWRTKLCDFLEIFKVYNLDDLLKATETFNKNFL